MSSTRFPFQRALQVFVVGFGLLGASTSNAAITAIPGDIAASTSSAKTVTLEGRLNVNTATVAQWSMLPGIGASTAKKIIAYRETHPFEQTIHVMRVKGIGRKKYNEVKPYLSIKGETTLKKMKAN